MIRRRADLLHSIVEVAVPLGADPAVADGEVLQVAAEDYGLDDSKDYRAAIEP